MRVVTLGGLGAVAPYISAPAPMLRGFGNTGSTPYGTSPIAMAQTDEGDADAPMVQTMLPMAAMQVSEERGHKKGLWAGIAIGAVVAGIGAYMLGRRSKR